MIRTFWSPRKGMTNHVPSQTPHYVEKDPPSLQWSAPNPLQTAYLSPTTTTVTSTTHNRRRRWRIRSGWNPRLLNAKLQIAIPSLLEGLPPYQLDLGTGIQYHACTWGNKGFSHQESICTPTASPWYQNYIIPMNPSQQHPCPYPPTEQNLQLGRRSLRKA